MGIPLRALIVEDSEDDVFFIRRELQHLGYEVELERVDTTHAMESALTQKTWDIILSDHSMPAFSAEQALEVLKASGLDIPFILISGTIGEDVAVSALKAGAHDFIIKGKYARLGPAIDRELREAESRRERRRAEQEIESLAKFPYEDISPVLRFARDGRLLYANPASADLLRMWGCKIGDRAPYEIQLIVYQSLVIPMSQEIEITHEDTIDALRFVPIVDKDYVNVYGRDITERKHAEEKLRQLNIELEQRVAERTAELNRTNIELEHANRIKDEFLANTSHELRTPLNSILGLSETLLEQRRGPLNDYQQKALQTIASSGQHLLELINDILDLSKLEAGKFEYYPQPVPVDDLCRSSLLFINSQAFKKSITVTYQNETGISKISADPRRIKQILINLLTNAIKFTPEHGQVTLQVQTDLEMDRIQFSVIDTGIGIAPEDLQQLFQPFVQVDSNLNRQFEGTGLGLALVQKLTDLHGGSVEVESKVGTGSRFTINLPIGETLIEGPEAVKSGATLLTAEPVQESNLPPPEPAGDVTILLAEDHTANVMTIGDYLESHGYKIVNASDGLEAIQKAEESNPDIILMDIQMPAMDGLEAIRRLRADPRFASTPIIALTALAMQGDRERCLAAGANEYLSKPVRLRTLLTIIQDFMKQKK